VTAAVVLAVVVVAAVVAAFVAADAVATKTVVPAERCRSSVDPLLSRSATRTSSSAAAADDDDVASVASVASGYVETVHLVSVRLV